MSWQGKRDGYKNGRTSKPVTRVRDDQTLASAVDPAQNMHGCHQDYTPRGGNEVLNELRRNADERPCGGEA